MRLGILRMLPIAWDPEYNFKHFELMARKAAAEGVEVLVTCECFLDGYCVEFGTVHALCKELHMSVVFGYSSLTEDGVKSTTLLLDQEGEEIGCYHKMHLNARDPSNIAENTPVFDTKWGRIGLLMGDERRWSEAARTLHSKGTQLILMPACGKREETDFFRMRTCVYENEFFWCLAT